VHADGGDVFNNPSEVVKFIEEEAVEFVDIRFCDLPGVMQHFNVPAGSFDEERLPGDPRVGHEAGPGSGHRVPGSLP
jgi:glutamine synthetase